VLDIPEFEVRSVYAVIAFGLAEFANLRPLAFCDFGLWFVKVVREITV
jgi:hypothetical protein